MFAARADHLEQKIRPALEAGTWVLCDRFTDATIAYQGGGRGVAFEHISALETMVQGELRPDLTLLLDLAIDLGEQRASARSSADRFERQAMAFKQRVRDAYLDIAKAEPKRVKVVDASASLEHVSRQIHKILQQFVND